MVNSSISVTNNRRDPVPVPIPEAIREKNSGLHLTEQIKRRARSLKKGVSPSVRWEDIKKGIN